MARKKPRVVDVVQYGSALATLKVRHPKQFRQLRQLARKRGVTLQGLVSGAPSSLQERSDAALRREARNSTRRAYAPLQQELNRREKANAALASTRASAQTAYQQWLDGQVSRLRAQGAAADSALSLTQAKIHDDLVTSQAATSADMKQRLDAAKLTSDTRGSTALAGVAAGQQAGLASEAAGREHTAMLTKIGDDARTGAYSSLLSTASTRRAQDEADNVKRSGELLGDREQLLLKRAADASGLLTNLRSENRDRAQAQREYALAQGELGAKREGIAADLKQFEAEFGLKKAQFNLERWKVRNAATVDRLKIQLGYDQIAERKGKHAADLALKRRIEQWREAHPNAGHGGAGGGATASERKEERHNYQLIQSLKSRALHASREMGQSDGVIRQNLLSKGYSDVMIDIALDLVHHNGHLSPAGIRKARNIGMHPLRYWSRASGGHDPNGPNAPGANGQDRPT
jgi:hypothetical protein